jgi:hypothetical protein
MFLLLEFEVIQEGVEAVEVALPIFAVTLEPFAGIGERSGFETARSTLRVASTRDEASALQNFQMLRDGWLGNGKGFGEL